MIKDKKQLKNFLNYEKNLYYKNKSFVRVLFEKITKESCMSIWKYQKKLRITEYFFNKRKKNIIYFIAYIFSLRKTNCLGQKLGIYIPVNVFDIGLKIDHYGSIIVNGNSRVGKNCRLHGNNCIGNKGVGKEIEYPIIGDNFDLGIGSVVIGNVEIGSNVVVGANAVVNKSFKEGNCVVLGIPAHKK